MNKIEELRLIKIYCDIIQMRLSSKYNASVTLRLIKKSGTSEFIIEPKDTIKKVIIEINWINIISFDKESIELCRFDKMMNYLSGYIDKDLK